MTTIQLYIAERTYLFAAALLSNSPFHLVCCKAIQIKTIGKNVDFFSRKMHDKLLVKEETCVVLAGVGQGKNALDCLGQLISIALGQVKMEIW